MLTAVATIRSEPNLNVNSLHLNPQATCWNNYLKRRMFGTRIKHHRHLEDRSQDRTGNQLQKPEAALRGKDN